MPRDDASRVGGLDDLAVAVMAEHEACHRAVADALEHARRCGELLVQAKREVAYGEWLPWLAVHCPTVAPTTAQNYMRVASRWPELMAKTQRVADLSLRQALKLLTSRRETDGAAALAGLPPAEGIELDVCRIIAGDLADITDIPAGSVDAIITDPPYGREHLALYETLGRRAAEWLRPGGSLVCMTGQSHLPSVLTSLGGHLTYRWTLAYLMPGCSLRVFGRSVFCEWKPVCWFVQEPYDGPFIADVVTSGARDKRYHDWQQNEAGFAALVERFTRPGDVVLDPFCGCGTTGAAAVRLDRRFIGIDVDGPAVDVARRRLSAVAAERGPGT
jgi:16S rRNA G966 N2-methylase RsmD